MMPSNWFQRKWGDLDQELPMDDVYKRLSQLELKVKQLEEENIETTNCLYELGNSIDAVDARIDIVAENPWKEQFNLQNYSLGDT